MMKNASSEFIPYARQQIGEDDVAAVVNVLRSGLITTGPQIEAFEQALSDYVGSKYAVVVSSGTAALHLAVAALDLPSGAEGITSPITFAASANCMTYNGLTPILADICEDTYCIDPAAVEAAITNLTKLLLPVHFAGQACDMESLHTLAKKYKLSIVEDAAHAIGSSYENGAKVGSGCYSDATAFSFHPVKTITTAEGGAVTTNNQQLYKKLVALRSHGVYRDSTSWQNHSLGFSTNTITGEDEVNSWYYEMQQLGFNYRMNELQAALGLSQFKKLATFAARRREIISAYNQALGSIKHLSTPMEKCVGAGVFHLYVVTIDFLALNKTRQMVISELQSFGVGAQVHYIPIHFLPYHSDPALSRNKLTAAESYYSSCLSLPLFPAMSDEDVARVIKAVTEVVRTSS